MDLNQQETRFIEVLQKYWPGFQVKEFTVESYVLGTSELDPELSPSWLNHQNNPYVAIDLVEAISDQAEVVQFVDFYDAERREYYGSEVLQEGKIILEYDAETKIWRNKTRTRGNDD